MRRSRATVHLVASEHIYSLDVSLPSAAGPASRPSIQAPSRARRRWAALIKGVWQVDPLHCPRCGSTMKIVSFIEPTQPDVIEELLRSSRAVSSPNV